MRRRRRKTNRKQMEWLMTLFSCISQVEKDCNTKSTNGFIVLRLTDFSRASNKCLQQTFTGVLKRDQQRERNSLKLRVTWTMLRPTVPTITYAYEFPHLFRKLLGGTFKFNHTMLFHMENEVCLTQQSISVISSPFYGWS